MPEMAKFLTEIHREVINNTGETGMLSQMVRFATLTHLRSNELLPHHSMESACFCRPSVTAEKKVQRKDRAKYYTCSKWLVYGGSQRFIL